MSLDGRRFSDDKPRVSARGRGEWERKDDVARSLVKPSEKQSKVLPRRGKGIEWKEAVEKMLDRTCCGDGLG